MVRQEWKKLFQNKGMLIVLIAIIAIPAIYTTLFLGSMWDPYGKVDQLPVAVVNQDKSAEYNGKTINIGEDLVESLKENDSLQFNFVSSSVAKEGLDNGTFYMTITIPEDFSENAATVLEDKPEKMQLYYETNPGTNYIASKMSDSALEKMKESVSGQVTKQYAQVMLENFGNVSEGMSEAADGAGEIETGLQNASEGSKTLRNSLQVLSDSVLEFQEGSEALHVSLKDYTSGVEKVNSGITQLTEGISHMKTGADSGADQLSQGSETLEAGVTGYTQSVHKLLEGTDQLQEKAEALNKGAGKMSEGVKASAKGSAQLTEGLQDLSDTIEGQLEAGKSGVAAVTKNLDTLSSGIMHLDTTLRQMEEQLSLNGDAAGAAALEQLLNSEEYQSLTENTEAVTEGAKTSVNTLVGAVTTIKNTLDTRLIPAGNQISQGMNRLYDAAAGEGGLQKGIAAYTSGVSKINSGLAALDKKSSELKKGMQSLDEGISSYTKGITEGTDMILQGAEASGEGTQLLSDANADLLQGSSRLSGAAVQIAGGTNKLLEGGRTLEGGIQELYKGSGELWMSLDKGASELEHIHKENANADMLAQPVDTVKSEASVVSDNGHAMAPYMMCVGLWVACIAFCLMYSLTDGAGRITSGFGWWISKVSVPVFVILSAGTVMIAALCLFNGFKPQRLWGVFAVAFLAGLSFMSVIYFFNILLGKVGSFLMLIFMVVQLAGAAGTYPVEVSADFVSVIHRWLPFSYGVDAFRKAICGQGSLYTDVKVLAVYAMVFGVCSLVVFELRTVKIRQGKKCFTEKLKIG